MNKTTKIVLWIVVIALVIWGISCLVKKNPAPVAVTSGEPIKIGLVLPLTGDFAFIGEEMKKGAEMALEDYPNENLQLIFEDGQIDSKTSINALQKLVNTDGVKLVFNSVVNTIKPMAPILDQKKTAGIVIWDNNKEITSLGKYVFGMGFSTELAGERMAEFAFESLKIKKVSIISAFDEWSEIITKAFSDKFIALGGKIDVHEKVNIDEKDLKINIAKVKQAGSEGLYLPLFAQSLNSGVKQAKELGFKGHLMSGDSFTDIDLENLGSMAENIYLTTLWLSDTTFSQKYKDKFGSDINPVSLSFAGMGYDAVKLAAELSRDMKDRGVELSAENIATNLVGFEISGITGVSKFAQDHTTDKQEPIIKVSDGRFVFVEN